MKALLARARDWLQRQTRHGPRDATVATPMPRKQPRAYPWPDEDLPDADDGWKTMRRRRRNG